MARLRILGAAIVLAALVPQAHAFECWRGWGYRLDGETRAYTSEEMLLVTEGPAEWAPGRLVMLYRLDRETGRIRRDLAPIGVRPDQPRVRYRGRSNYVDGEGAVEGGHDRIVFGLQHVAPPTSGLAGMEAHVAWACGRGGEGNFSRP